MIRLRLPLLFAVLALIGITTTQCSKDSMDPNTATGISHSRKQSTSTLAPLTPSNLSLDVPTLSLKTKGMASLVLTVCAGPTGAPAGFTVQWMKKSDYVAAGNTWNSNAASYCDASFSGNANSSRYNLGANGCVDVRIGEILHDNGASTSCDKPLQCGNTYVFRVFAHNVPGGAKKSDFSGASMFATWNCELKPNQMCTKTAGEWRSNPLAWPVNSLMLGTRTYTKTELINILNATPANNGLVALAQQEIATKLNVAAGSPDSYVWHPLLMVDQMIGNLVIPPVGGGSLPYSTVNARYNYLNDYNDGAIGPGHCFE